MDQSELSRIILSKDKKIAELEAKLIAKGLYDEIENLEACGNLED